MAYSAHINKWDKFDDKVYLLSKTPCFNLFSWLTSITLHYPYFYQVNGMQDSEQRITYQQLEGLILLEGSCSATALTTIPEKRESN